MEATLRELFPDKFPRYTKGEVFVVKLKPLFEKSKHMLVSHKENLRPEKSRPIIIVKELPEKRQFIATSKDKRYEGKRPVFPINCLPDKKMPYHRPKGKLFRN